MCKGRVSCPSVKNSYSIPGGGRSGYLKGSAGGSVNGRIKGGVAWGLSVCRSVPSSCPVGGLKGGGSCGRGVREGLKVLAVCPWVIGLVLSWA